MLRSDYNCGSCLIKNSDKHIPILIGICGNSFRCDPKEDTVAKGSLFIFVVMFVPLSTTLTQVSNREQFLLFFSYGT